MNIKRVAIVGGGSAGWMAANHLGAELSRDPSIEITLIESKDIPVIGVGEGTVPRIKETLQKFGISEIDLITRCDVSFKQGIKFANWMDKEKHGVDNFYYHPFSSPYPSGFDVNNYWLSQRDSLEYSRLSEIYLVAEANKSPKHISSGPYSGAVDYAFHFNAAKFSLLLAENAKERFAVKHKYETIEQVELNSDGSIKSLIYSSREEEKFDFYVDCSGFRSVLMERLAVPFLDKSSQILTDSALVLQEPTTENMEIAPYTLATAHDAGWIWDIPLTSRRGLGFVYSSAHMSESQVEESFSSYLGRDLGFSDLRKVPMKIGFRKKFWEKNCVALGLAQGFVEPLEATSILVTDFSAQLLAKNFPKTTQDCEILSEHCNRAVEYTWERVIDFIQLHYFVSDRRDTDFWRDCTSNENMSDVLRERLAMWRLAPPKSSDFFSSFDIFGVENYLFVLYGMLYPTRKGILGPGEAERSSKLIATVNNNSQDLLQKLLPHREWLGKLDAQLKRAAR